MSDWIAPLVPAMDDRKSLRLARLLTIGFAAVQCGVAIGAYEISLRMAIVDLVLGIAGFAIGLLLGLYGLGLIVPRTSERVALMAFAVGTLVTGWTLTTSLNSYWYTLVGSGTIVGVGIVLSLLMDRRDTPSSSREAQK